MNGHAHLLYALNIAVRTAPDSSVKALKYAAAIERSLCEKLCADVNYSGLICKNPFHLEWQVMEWREEAYTLDELADYLDLSASARRSIDKHYGMGRNCHLFEMTRKWAYRAIRQGWPEFSQWLDAVIQRVEMYNASLPVPLSPPECRAIGKSIAKYTHRNFTPSRVKGHLNRYKRYPGDARKRARTGTAVVTFTVNTEGTIVSSFLEISSGTFSLDREAIAVLERAQPLPKPPPEILEGGLFKVKMPITFKLKE